MDYLGKGYMRTNMDFNKLVVKTLGENKPFVRTEKVWDLLLLYLLLLSLELLLLLT